MLASNDPLAIIGDWTEIARIDLDDAKEAMPVGTSFPIPFSITVTENDGLFALVRPYDSKGTFGDASKVVVLTTSVEPRVYTVKLADGTTGDVTTFVAVTTGLMPFDWYWYFGPAAFPSTSSKENPTVILGNPGEYNCSVRVSNPYSASYFQFPLKVDEEPVPPPPPVTAFAVPGAYPEQYGDAPYTVTLICNQSYSTAGEIVLYEWDFESDGVIDVTQESPYHVIHEFPQGEYFVTLYVTDVVGYRASAELYIVALSSETQWNLVKELTASIGFNMVDILIQPTSLLPALAYVKSDFQHVFLYEDYPGHWMSDVFTPSSRPDELVLGEPVITPDGTVFWFAMYQWSLSNSQHVAYIKRDSNGNWQEPYFVEMDIKTVDTNIKTAIHPDGYPALIYNAGTDAEVIKYAWMKGNVFKNETTGIKQKLGSQSDLTFIEGKPTFCLYDTNLTVVQKNEGVWQRSVVSIPQNRINYLSIAEVDGETQILNLDKGFTSYELKQDGQWFVRKSRNSILDISSGKVATNGKVYLCIYLWKQGPFTQVRYSVIDISDYTSVSTSPVWKTGIVLPGGDYQQIFQLVILPNGDAYALVGDNSPYPMRTVKLLGRSFD